MPKVLITGASGLLGRSMVRLFSENGWDVIGLAHSRSKEGDKLRRKCDLTKEREVRAIIFEVRPDVIVHW
jgi:S-adenosylmethionine synthetase